MQRLPAAAAFSPSLLPKVGTNCGSQWHDPHALEFDDVVTGASATARAFVDALLCEQPDASVLTVDCRDRPGGHLNDACSVVRLHQPSEFCGGAGRGLSHEVEDTRELNVGTCGPASGDQVLTSSTQGMQWRFLPGAVYRT